MSPSFAVLLPPMLTRSLARSFPHLLPPTLPPTLPPIIPSFLPQDSKRVCDDDGLIRGRMRHLGVQGRCFVFSGRRCARVDLG